MAESGHEGGNEVRLGVVARTVIVASCFWMVGGTFFIANKVATEAQEAATVRYNDCVKTGPEGYVQAHTAIAANANQSTASPMGHFRKSTDASL